MEQAKRGHIPRAIELAEEAVECDPKYLECRRWLADTYEQTDQPRLASRHLQELIHADHEDKEAWAALERVDPMGAERLQRMAAIGPDPFVSHRQRTQEELEEFEDFEEIAEAGVVPQELSEDRLVPTHGKDEVMGGIDELAEDLVEEDGGESGPSRDEFDTIGEGDKGEKVESVESGQTGSEPLSEAPQPWEHEQDRPYRDKMLADPLLAHLVQVITESWRRPDSWLPVIDVCAHATKERYGELYEAVEIAQQVLRAPAVTLLIVPESSPHSLPLRETEREVAFNTGLLRCMQGPQLVFTAARAVAMFASGAVPFYHTTLLVTDRPSLALGQCEEAAKEFLWDLAGGWFESHPKDQREHAAKLAHAWEMRCVLSCDRAGLLACGELDAACDAVARMCCKTPTQAANMGWRTLIEKHKGRT